MVTFKAIVISTNRRKDGTYPVKIRVTFKGVSRRLPTTMVCTSSDLTRSLKIKSATILSKSDELIGRMRAVTSSLSPFDLEAKDVDWVVGKIKDAMSGDNFHLDFFEWGEAFIGAKSVTTRDTYVTALNALARFLGQRHLDINSISRSMLTDFAAAIGREPKMRLDARTGDWKSTRMPRCNNAASSRYISKLQHIFNAARDKYNDEDADRILIPRSPFNRMPKVPQASHGQRNLGQELMQKIIFSDAADPRIRIALDAFVVSFALMGANMADLFAAAPFKGGTWIYNRQKTHAKRVDHAEMRVDIPDQLQPYLRRLQEGNKKWWLPKLHNDVGDCSNYTTNRVNAALRMWCRANDVPVFTFYAARHTWASLARKAGIEKATIDECLAHKGDYSLTDIYAERSWELLQAANNRVLALFEWE